jgi:1-acyl-sn-glycerol-3-phosphate acyltransferase
MATLVYGGILISMAMLGLSATITWPLSPNGKLVSEHMRIWSQFVLSIMGIKYEVHGLEHLDSKQHYVFTSNHESFTDTPLIYRCALV